MPNNQRTPPSVGVKRIPSPPAKDAQSRPAVPHLNQHSAQLQRIAQAKMAQPRPVSQPVVSTSRPVVQRSTVKKPVPSFAPPPSSPKKSVVQRMQAPPDPTPPGRNPWQTQGSGVSGFDASKVAHVDQYVVTQIDSGMGMFGHSELFIEHWDARRQVMRAHKIHLQTLGTTRIDIVPVGQIDPTRVKAKKTYIANHEQFQTIMQSAMIIRNKMDQGIIIYAELFCDWNPKWKEATTPGSVEMSCKSFTDALLIEAGLREKYGGLLLNAPWDL